MDAWSARDQATYLRWLAPTITRASRFSGLSRGVPATLAGLPIEWEQFEQSKGKLGLNLGVRALKAHVSGGYAFARYEVEAVGSAKIRWRFSDHWLVEQVYEPQSGGSYLLLQESIAPLTEADEEEVDHWFSVPVAELPRATAFYTRLLGTPERVERNSVSFRAGGSRFLLDGTRLGGLAKLRPGKPNGYSTLLLPQATFQQASKRGVPVAPIEAEASRAGDSASVVLDPAGNPLVLRLQRFSSEAAAPVDPVFPAETPAPIAALWRGWLQAKPTDVLDTLTADATWFDDARPGADARSRTAIGTLLANHWKQYDRSEAGLALRLSFGSLQVMPTPGGVLVSYTLLREGTGPHAFRDELLVTDILDGNRIRSHFALTQTLSPALVSELDYAAYPATNLTSSARFYRSTFGMQSSYQDEGWVGFWGKHAVFGLFEANHAEDGFPTALVPSAYVSFSVRSAAAVQKELAALGASFPVLPSINTRPGVDRQPGYTQVVATDSEGNVVVFTEYTGRRGR